jgi:hypothetical protein
LELTMPTYVTMTEAGPIWQGWATGTTSSTNVWTTWLTDTDITTANDTWTRWVVTHSTATTTARSYHAPPRDIVTPETLERERQAARAARLVRERAQAAAEALLLASVGPRQAAQFRRFGWFTVRGPSGTHYRVRQGRVGNVDVLDPQGRVIERLCAHPAADVPDCDTMLAQALMLGADDQEFRRVANRHPAFQGDPVPLLELQ